MVPKFYVIVDENGPLKDWPYIDWFVSKLPNQSYTFKEELAEKFDAAGAIREVELRTNLYGRKHRTERVRK